MKNENLIRALFGLTTLATGVAHADTTIAALKAQVPQGSSLTLSGEQVAAMGLDISSFVNKEGQKRSLVPNEPVKVELHEESNSISFSSFDGYALSVLGGEGTSCPRNIDENEQ